MKNKKIQFLKKKNFEFLKFIFTFFCQLGSDFVPGRPGTGRDSLFKIPSRAVPWQDFELVPLSRKVAVSRPVGSPKLWTTRGKFFL